MLELILKVDTARLGVGRRILPDTVSFEPVSSGRSTFLVVGQDGEWEPRSLQRALSKRFENVRRVRTGNGKDGVYFVAEGSDALRSLIEQVEARGPETEVQAGMVSRKQLFLRVLSAEKTWVQSQPGEGLELVHGRVYAPRWSDVDFLRHGLTKTELEAARMAVKNGYYATPRRCTMSDIAEDLGISKSAVYHRLSGFERTLAARATDVPHEDEIEGPQAPTVARGQRNGSLRP